MTTSSGPFGRPRADTQTTAIQSSRGPFRGSISVSPSSPSIGPSTNLPATSGRGRQQRATVKREAKIRCRPCTRGLPPSGVASAALSAGRSGCWRVVSP